MACRRSCCRLEKASMHRRSIRLLRVGGSPFGSPACGCAKSRRKLAGIFSRLENLKTTVRGADFYRIFLFGVLMRAMPGDRVSVAKRPDYREVTAADGSSMIRDTSRSTSTKRIASLRTLPRSLGT